jgi:RNA polymerase sigma factor (sigma-70 family)
METNGTDEAALWSRGAAGDGAAFGVIFDLHQARVSRHARRLLQDPTDAEDAAAIAFLELWRRRTAVRVVEGSVLPWLLVTATNAARNLKRSRNRYKALLDALPPANHHPSAEDVAMTEALTDANLIGALARLSQTDAQLVTLVLLEGYSAVEAATVLGITAGAVRTRVHRARAALRTALGHPTLDLYLHASLGDPA